VQAGEHGATPERGGKPAFCKSHASIQDTDLQRKIKHSYAKRKFGAKISAIHRPNQRFAVHLFGARGCFLPHSGARLGNILNQIRGVY
jgi:hypothetical protein